MTDSYFGAYGSASSRTDDAWFGFDWSGCADCPGTSECDDRCDAWAAIPRDRIAGFLFEPGSSSGLVRFPPRKLIRNIVVIVKENDGLVLVNEVTTGVGRTGNWFGYQHYDLQPDIVALGKGIGNGYPVSVAAFAGGLVSRLEGGTLKYAQSHQNDPLGAAVALEVVRTIRDEGLIERGWEMATLLESGLEQIRERTGRIEEVRAQGLMVALELKDDERCSRTVNTHRELARRGFVLGRRPGLPVLRLDPSLTIERQDIRGFLATLEDLLR